MNVDHRPAVNRFAAWSFIAALSFPLVLLFTFHRDYLVNPWEMIPSSLFLCSLLLPILAVISGHIAGARMRNFATRGLWCKRVGLLLGYSGIIAIPFITARYANPHYEASAVGSLRTIRAAAAAYEESHAKEGFPASLDQFSWRRYGSRDCAWCLDDALSVGTKGAYRFTYVPQMEGSMITAYRVYADPIQPRNPYTKRHFLIDQTGTIRIEDNVPANSRSRKLE